MQKTGTVRDGPGIYGQITLTRTPLVRPAPSVKTLSAIPEFTGRIRNLLFDCISVAWAQVEFQALFNRVTSLFSGILSVYIELSAFIVNHNESVAVTTKK